MLSDTQLKKEIRLANTHKKKKLISLYTGNLNAVIYPPTKTTKAKASFVIRTKENGKIKQTTLGSYPALSISEAIRLATHIKSKALLNGVSKHEQSKLIKHQNKTFKDAFHAYIDFCQYDESSQKPKAYKGMIKNHAKGFINKPLRSVTKQDIIKAIEALKDQKFTAKIFLAVLKRFFTYARLNDFVEINPTSDLNGLKSVFGAYKAPQVRHHPHPHTNDEIRHYLRTLDTVKEPNYKMLFTLITYTAVRLSTATGTQWDEIDLKRGVWSIPAKRMKTKEPFTLQLPQPLVDALKAYKATATHATLLFPALRRRDASISKNTALEYFRRYYPNRDTHSIHGLRGLFSTLCYEYDYLHKISHDVIEKALSHKDTNKVRAAYNHSEKEKQQRELLSWYYDKLQEIKGG